ncbi:ABC transporter ATP-binding protein [Prochlorothrix hollandica]|uniref:Macrolide ABC transporter ATP-binding protein n=1 Tax=Prochlorothrix hollandica PCC 9006 = CALU 1027 TaxID=317619 RepID=A0A0M2PTW4_PROHO|nr:ABC transporter ATP-binding protein [Prochlorothrix hollandica]KKI98118.1 macrolide ABC transporter ATP-binding protein [Prochlorothrix hollandica PCC 9006 = CALU 1027]
MNPPIIALSQISKTYGLGDTLVHALDQVDLTLTAGEYGAVIGTSGSGKSTLMNVVGCLDRPSLGQYHLDGVAVADLDDLALAQVRNRKIGFIFQQFHLLPQLTALDNVILPMIYGNVPKLERQARAKAALERVGLGNRLGNRPNQLSGGQQQRVAIARAIVNEPVLLLADEPTGALDSHTTQEVLAIFDELHHSGITILVVTHETEVAQRADRIITFRDGKILSDVFTVKEAGAVPHGLGL